MAFPTASATFQKPVPKWNQNSEHHYTFSSENLAIFYFFSLNCRVSNMH